MTQHIRDFFLRYALYKFTLYSLTYLPFEIRAVKLTHKLMTKVIQSTLSDGSTSLSGI